MSYTVFARKSYEDDLKTYPILKTDNISEAYAFVHTLKNAYDFKDFSVTNFLGEDMGIPDKLHGLGHVVPQAGEGEYLAFCGDNYYPSGGAFDLKARTDNWYQALGVCKAYLAMDSMSWAHIWDLTKTHFTEVQYTIPKEDSNDNL